jgi:hypothetical protein
METDEKEHRRKIASTVNQMLGGKMNCTGTLTLAATATATVLTDARIGPASVILLMPATASAAAAVAGLYVGARGKGSATLSHAAAPATDQRFGYAVIG